MIKVSFQNGIISLENDAIPWLDDFDYSNVLIKVNYSGLCGSDVHRLKEFFSIKNNIPTLGHEIVGTVFKSSAKRFKVGDIVVVQPMGYCAECENCLLGKIQFCNNSINIGKNIDGGFSEYIKVPERLLYKINFLEKEYALTDSLACIIHSENSIGKIKNKHICIIGDGSVSEIAVRYFSLDNQITNLVKNSESCNDIYCNRINIEEARKEPKFRDMFDIVLECVGGNNEYLIDYSVNLLKYGGILIALGVYKKDFYPKIYLRNLLFKEIKLIGSNSFVINQKIDEFSSAVKFINKNIKRLGGIITHEISLKDFKLGLDIFNDKKTTKAKKIVFI